MRLLVECPDCRRQYDATGKAVGARFRCHCGAAVTVKRPEGRAAAVVRCSSCGAPRTEESRNCRFCDADFTLHERDLHTVCPRCLARVSDRAKFCHHCATVLVPELVAGDQTPLVCPACDRPHQLTSRRIGQVTVLECNRCAGLWLGNDAFEQLTDRAADAAIGADTFFKSMPDSLPADAPSGKWHYRHCPLCSQLMHRRHYGRNSGVIIDVCKVHGIWFDPDELPRILAWIRSGREARANQEAADQPVHVSGVGDRNKTFTGSGRSVPDPAEYGVGEMLADLGGQFFHWIFK